MERESLDRTPFTPEQIEYLPRAYEVLSGVWSEVSQEGLELKRADGRFGEVWSLTVDGFGWMMTNPTDLLDHRKLLEEACGPVLLTGFGLGVGALFADMNPQVRTITILEADDRVRRLVWPMVARRLRKPTRLIKADADKFDYGKERFAFAFVDHAREAPPAATIERIRLNSDRVVVWLDEFREVTATWQ